VENFLVGSLPVESFPVKTLSTRDQNGKLSTDKVCVIYHLCVFFLAMRILIILAIKCRKSAAQVPYECLMSAIGKRVYDHCYSFSL
jgi:hypothetical protein